MFEQPRYPPEAWLAAGTGLLWLWCAASFGVVGFLFSVIPGCLLLASGVSTLLYPGDLRIPQFTAFGGIVGVPLAIPAIFVEGAWTGLALMALSAASFVAAGSVSVRQELHVEEVPTPRPSLRLSAQVAIDDAILATAVLRASSTGLAVGERARVRGEVHAARELFRERRWLEAPASYHQTPPPLTDPIIRPGRSRGIDFEHVEFDSHYEPWPEEPGRDRWLSRTANRRAHAWVLRHRDRPRPWLIGIHGYEMGIPFVDLPAFRAELLHRKHGMNLVLPVLPLHGPRRIGGRSGAGFLTGDFLDTVHAEAQAMWDIRRLITWIRAQDGDPIGVHGLSLGGYNTALLASLEELACAIPGIPAVDFTRLTWRHGPPLEIRRAERDGFVHDEIREVLSVVSPLALQPKVARERRYIFAGISDRLVPPDQPRDLWIHWDRPRIVWYQGAHVTFRMHRETDRLIMDALRESGLCGAA